MFGIFRCFFSILQECFAFGLDADSFSFLPPLPSLSIGSGVMRKPENLGTNFVDLLIFLLQFSRKTEVDVPCLGTFGFSPVVLEL